MSAWRKPLLALLAALATGLLSLPAAAGGQHALYTDRIARINGHPLRTYEVSGEYFVVAEDLADYGFSVTWSGEARRLEVVRAADRDHRPVTPSQWPTPPVPQGAPGEAAADILPTDIHTLVAGQTVEAHNIGGETLLRLSDLSAYGTVAQDETGAPCLTLGDAQQLCLDALIANIVSWSGREDSYTLLPHPEGLGTLFFCTYTGTSHGASAQMVFVRPDGTSLDIIGLLPAHGFGASYYASPREVRFEGGTLVFVTPICETDDETGVSTRWGDTLCRVDLTAGEIRFEQETTKGA